MADAILIIQLFLQIGILVWYVLRELHDQADPGDFAICMCGILGIGGLALLATLAL